jgi:hypothetical protein
MTKCLFDLFTVAELLERLGQTRKCGRLHVFTEGMTGDLYLQDGCITSASLGKDFGPPAVQAVLQLGHPNWHWLPDVKPASAPLKLQVAAALLEHRIHQDHRLASQGSMAGTTPLPSMCDIEGRPDPKVTRWTLYFVETDEELQLQKDGSIIGREATCDITIPHPSVSRRHCLLRVTHRGIHLLDLGSTNGTYVREHRVGEGIIGNGDEFVVGDFTIRCLLNASAPADESDGLYAEVSIRGGHPDPNRTMISPMPRPSSAVETKAKALPPRKSMLAF